MAIPGKVRRVGYGVEGVWLNRRRHCSSMWQKLSLRARIYSLLSALVLINILGGTVMVWYAARMEGLITHIIEKNLSPFEMALSLETALINQKGFVSYYFTGLSTWLNLPQHIVVSKCRIRPPVTDH